MEAKQEPEWIAQRMDCQTERHTYNYGVLRNGTIVAHLLTRTEAEFIVRACNSLAALTAEVERLREVVNVARGVLYQAPELNMSNYDEDEVSALNAGACEAYAILDKALPAPNQVSE